MIDTNLLLHLIRSMYSVWFRSPAHHKITILNYAENMHHFLLTL